MKRPIFIIIGTVLVFILLAIWIYILFFAKPSENDLFTDLNFGDSQDTEIVTQSNEATSSAPTLDINSGSNLVQITTEPTAGYQEVFNETSSSSELFFVKSGTGHLFSVDLKSGKETQLTNTTISLTRQAEITPNGKFVMIQTGNRGVLTGELSKDDKNLVTHEIKENVTSFKATDTNTFLYSVQENNSTVGKEYNPSKDSTKTLFTIPFREATVVWGDAAEDIHHLYPKAASKLEGYGYQIKQGNIKRLPVSGYGLSIYGDSKSLIYSYQVSDSYKTFFLNKETNTKNESPLTIIPEKCSKISQSAAIYICGETGTDYNHNIPDSWYQGVVSYADMLWEVNAESNSARLLVDVSGESGREIDIIKPSLNMTDERVYFMNKNDLTLWLYKRTISNNE